MAKDRLFFLVSFAFLGIIAAFLFRAPAPEPMPKSELKIMQMQTDAEQATVEVLMATDALKEHDPLSQKNTIWKKINVTDFNGALVTKTPETEKLLARALAAKEIVKDAKINRSDIFWPIEEVKNEEPESLPISAGNRAVPFEITKRFGLIQFLKPGMLVNIAFSTKMDSDFGAVSLTLLKNIRVLAVGSNEDESAGKPGARNISNAPFEILLEMTPRESDLYFYAKSSGELSLEFLDDPEKHQNPLEDKLLESNSPGDFRSILVTHMIHSLFPDTDVTVTTIPKGYIASGKVPELQKAMKIIEVLGRLAADGDKAVVNLIESNKPPPEIPVKKIENEKEPEILQAKPGKIAVLYDFSETAAMIPFIEPGMSIDIMFNSKPDIGFGAVSLVLFEDIPILGVANNPKKHFFNKSKNQNSTTSQVQVVLEMTPRQSEIFHYAQSVGIASLGLAERDPQRERSALVKRLLKSKSSEDFRSTLITSMVRSLFPRVDVQIIATSKGYVVEGKVADPQKAEKIMEIIQKLAPADDKAIVNLLEVEPQQVLINVKVMEVDSRVTGNLGLNWQVLFNHDATSAAFAAVTPPIDPLAANYFVKATGVNFGNFTLSALINMLEQDNGTKVLAEPNLTTTSGKTAHFFAGGEFPILIPQGGALLGTVTVEYKKYGVILDFTPTVGLNGLITMQVTPEISTLDRANAVILSGFVLPGLVSRRVDTTVKLWPGQSYVIAGLLQSEQTQVETNLYGLNRLPIIGPLFASKNFENKESELMIIVTPYLISTDKADVQVNNKAAKIPCDLCGMFHDYPEMSPCDICGCIHDACGQVCQWVED